jgi:pimeloyl-ACP methyl ester carboxylesterase
LLLLHGLGATPGVWHGVVEAGRWPGRVVVPALPGHATAAWSGDYTLGALAAAVSASLGEREPVVAVGHSLGGAVGMALASGWFRPEVTALVGVGVKVAWTDEDVVGMAKVARRGIRWFDTEAEAVDRFLLQSGLSGVAGPGHPAVVDAVVHGGGRWRVAQDPATFAQRPVDTAQLLAAATCPVLLAAGDDDAMCGADDLGRYVADAPRRAGRGHNVHVEDPQWVLELLDRVVASAAGLRGS